MAEPMRCTCTMLRSATHESPAEWEQDPTCEMHYDRATVVRMLEALTGRLVEAMAGMEGAETREEWGLQFAHRPDVFPRLSESDARERARETVNRSWPVRRRVVVTPWEKVPEVREVTDVRLHSYGPAADGLGRVVSVDGEPRG